MSQAEMCSAPEGDIESDADDSVSMGSDHSIPPETFSDAIQSWPLEKWIHTRFCLTYQVHTWAHDRLVRVLLFGLFCHRQTLPSAEDILITTCVAKGLRRKWGDDIWALIEPFILAEGMLKWKELAGQANWTLDFQEMSKEERGVMVLFSDTTSDSLNPDSILETGPTAFQEAAYFLTDPVDLCPDQPDIVGLASHLGGSVEDTSLNIIDIPSVDPAICLCGKCISLQDDLQRIPENFQMKYLAMSISTGRGGCRALEMAWDPLLTQAEQWIETLMDRIECPFDLFPYTSERRLGISVVEVLIKRYLKIDSQFDTRQLLRFITHLRYRHVWAESHMDEPSEMTKDDFAFVMAAEPEDAEDSPYIISTAGGWLYDIAGGGLDDQESTVYFIPTSDPFSIRFLSAVDDEIRAIRMPLMELAGPIFMPPDHATLDAHEVPPSSRSSNSRTVSVTVDLSWESIHGFPLLCSTSNDKTSPFDTRNEVRDDKYGAQISAYYGNRLFRTWWRPQVVVGRPCNHRDDYNRMTRCSLTSKQVLLQVKPRNDPLSNRWLQTDEDENVDPEDEQAEARKTASIFFQHHKEITSFLTGPQGPFERGRLCIVRCADDDDESDEGPVDPVIILAASLGMRAYVFHFRECWNCACTRMRAQRCTLGIVIGTKVVTKCVHCEEADRRAERIVNELGL